MQKKEKSKKGSKKTQTINIKKKPLQDKAFTTQHVVKTQCNNIIFAYARGYRKWGNISSILM